MVIYIRQVFFGLIILFFCFLIDIISITWMFFALIVNSPRYWTIAVAKDQSLNASIGGKNDETLSSRAARARLRGDRWGCVLCKFLDYIDKDHCQKYMQQRKTT